MMFALYVSTIFKISGDKISKEVMRRMRREEKKSQTCSLYFICCYIQTNSVDWIVHKYTCGERDVAWRFTSCITRLINEDISVR